jgi:RHS repeat-associated protein
LILLALQAQEWKVNMDLKKIAVVAVITVLLFVRAPAAFADQGDQISASQRLGQYQNINPLGVGAFGDKLDGYSGSLSFQHTDVSLPGNSDLQVKIVRELEVGATRKKIPWGKFTFSTGTTNVNYFIGTSEFGDWRLQIPSVSGFVPGAGAQPTGWQPTQCSGTFTPPSTITVTTNGAQFGFFLEQYWSGWRLEIPGDASRTLLQKTGTTVPFPGDVKIVTADKWIIRCVSNATGHGGVSVGEGYLATSPEGVTYTLNKLVYDPEPSETTYFPIPPRGSEPFILNRQTARMVATHVQDRFGNYVNYNYDSLDRLTSIVANDGREIDLTYVGTGPLVNTVSAAGHTWTYGYDATNNNALLTVTRPDGQAWHLDPKLDTPATQLPPGLFGHACGGVLPITATLTSPEGLKGTFTFSPNHRNIAGYPQFITGDSPVLNECHFALTQKQLSGPGLSALNWSYQYSSNPSWSSAAPPSPAPTTQTTTTVDPEGVKTINTFSYMFDSTEYELLSTQVISSTGVTLRTTTNSYQAGPAIGITGLSYASFVTDAQAGQSLQLLSQTTSQEGDSYYKQTPSTAFDGFGNATQLHRYNSFGGDITDNFTYLNDSSYWVLNQLQQRVVGTTVVENHLYNTLDQLQESDSFGVKKFSYLYNPDGTLASSTDGRGNATNYSNYFRGVPRLIQRPDSTSTSATVNSDGTIATLTDGRGNTTSYSYDTLGRLAGITYPSADSVAWAAESISWQNVTTSPAGAAAVLRTHNDGHLQTSTYYDPLLQPLFEQQKDLVTGVLRDFSWSYDSHGRKTFNSYASNSSTTSAGVTTNYDALGRVTKTFDGLGTISSFSFLAHNTTQETNGNSNVTTIGYQAFDQPDASAPILIQSPAGQTTSVSRDVFGHVLSATQSGVYAGATVSATRSYVYDSNFRLCKSVDPETGQTSIGYDTASNVAWKAIAAGTATSCTAQSAIPATQLTTFAYDPMNRVTNQTEPAGTDSVTTQYDADGRLHTLSTPITAWTYGYDKRGLLETQSLVANGVTFNISDQYDPQGHVKQRTYPNGLITAYAPNAWGKPTQVGSFATGISYQPNGIVANFSYGNGLAYSQSLDARLRPYVIQASGGSAGNIVDLQYAYDSDNNVTTITDNGPGSQSRTLGYDGLDRLTAASGIWGNATYAYDPLDNLRTQIIGTQTINTTYNASTNRIDGISGGITRSYHYDSQGNLVGNGVNQFTFDIANRLIHVGNGADYHYDGHGRRTLTADPGVREYSIYDLSGNLVSTLPNTGAVATNYINLQGKAVAQTISGVTTYLHSDSLGSPIAATNDGGAWLWYEEYQPYGLKLNGVSEKIGFTGHVYDADTGLTYMQARLYDPLVGRFLSTDPIAFNASSPFTFNRYAYANNNPYRYTDPTGQCLQCFAAVAGALIAGAVNVGVQMATNEPGVGINWASAGRSAVVGAIAGATGVGVVAAIESATGRAVATTALGGVFGGTSKAVENVATGKPAGEGVATAVAIGAVVAVAGQVVAANVRAIGTESPNVNNAAPTASAAVQVAASTSGRVAGAATNAGAKIDQNLEEKNKNNAN